MTRDSQSLTDYVVSNPESDLASLRESVQNKKDVIKNALFLRVDKQRLEEIGFDHQKIDDLLTVVTEALFVEPTIDYNSEAFKTFVKDRVGDVSMWPSNVEDSYLDAIIATAIEEYEK